MAREFASPFYNSRTWRRTSKAFAASKNNLCERCLKNGKYVPYKIVHHKVYINPSNITDPMVTLNWNNLEALCQDCHNKEHFQTTSPVREGLKFDENGNLIQLKK